MRLGVMGGTFDPVHVAHLRVAMEVQSSLQLDRVHFIPNSVPPHRLQPRASIAQRLAMLELALAPHERFVLDRREIERAGPSYMVDTLASLANEYDASICLILGTDAFNGLMSWHQWERLWEFAHIVIAHRPDSGSIPDELLNKVAHRQVNSLKQLFECHAGSFIYCPVTQLDISASGIRERVAADEDIQYLVPDNVIDYIQQEKLYIAGNENAG